MNLIPSGTFENSLLFLKSPAGVARVNDLFSANGHKLLERYHQGWQLHSYFLDGKPGGKFNGNPYEPEVWKLGVVNQFSKISGWIKTAYFFTIFFGKNINLRDFSAKTIEFLGFDAYVALCDICNISKCRS